MTPRARVAGILLALGGAGAAGLGGQGVGLLPDSVIAALASELSGSTARKNLDVIAAEHRIRGSRGWHRAAEHVVSQLKAYGIADAAILNFPTDGQRFYGTQKGRRAWDADFAELWMLRQEGGEWVRGERLASFDAMPVSLAQDSETGKATAALVDVGDGTSERDYAGKDVRGKLVLAAQQPVSVQRLAVEKYGAVGIVSYAQNQRTAWWQEDESLVRWGHLESFGGTPTFAFMLSLKQAKALRARLAAGEEVRLDAEVRAGKHDGGYELVTATIPGADPALRNEEIAYSCHLDHQRPGANDNASGCVTILEVARTLSRLIDQKRIARPARTLRFIWPPEIEGTLALLNGRPEIAARIKAAIHMDMVGGGPVTKAVFHVTRGPMSLPSFVHDVADYFGALVNRESYDYAATGSARYPFVAPDGGKEPLLAVFADFETGSDHVVYQDGAFGIPAISLNDWPDRYIHTNGDVPASIDPTKLMRAAFIGAASGYYLATLRPAGEAALRSLVNTAVHLRMARTMERGEGLSAAERENLDRAFAEYEAGVSGSIGQFLGARVTMLENARGRATPDAAAPIVYRRSAAARGPMSVFHYDYFTDHYGAEKAAALKLPRAPLRWGEGGALVYEALNFVNGRRSVAAIRDALVAEFGPIPLDMVVEYLGAMAEAKVIERVTP